LEPSIVKYYLLFLEIFHDCNGFVLRKTEKLPRPVYNLNLYIISTLLLISAFYIRSHLQKLVSLCLIIHLWQPSRKEGTCQIFFLSNFSCCQAWKVFCALL